jgi:hypothetical protein
MMPASVLELQATMASCYGIYWNKAAFESDPVERMKYAIVGALAYFYFEQGFEKPLNPILGETYEAHG